MKKISEKFLFSGNWLTLSEHTFLNKNNESVKWEIVERKNNKLVLLIVPFLYPSNRYVLIRQFRCPVNNYIIGFPAGVTDLNQNDEFISLEALRELKEETGYSGKIISKSPLLKANTGIMDDNVIIVTVLIDENDINNLNPVQSLEPEEEIETVIIHKNNIYEYLLKEKKEGTEIGSGVWLLFGMNL